MITPEDLHAKLNADNLRAWLEHEILRDHASENQRERYAAGMLPIDELATIARAILFTPFAAAKRWAKLASWNIHHQPQHVVTSDLITYDVKIGAPISGPQWDALKRLNAMIEVADQHPWLVRSHQRFSAEVRQHTATCGICKRSCKGVSVLIGVTWADRPLSREYALV